MKRFLVLYESQQGVYPNESQQWVPWALAPVSAANADDLLDMLNHSGVYRIYELAGSDPIEAEVTVTSRTVYDREVRRYEVP